MRPDRDALLDARSEARYDGDDDREREERERYARMAGDEPEREIEP